MGQYTDHPDGSITSWSKTERYRKIDLPDGSFRLEQEWVGVNYSHPTEYEWRPLIM